MITSFEVGAIFRIVNQASPALRTILAQVRTLQAAIDKARASLDLVAKPAGLTAAIAETGDLAKAWGDVAKNAGSARLAIGRASSASVRPLIAGAGSVALPGGGRQRLGQRMHGGGSGIHFGGPSAALPGGGHVNFRGGAAAAIGAVGYGAYEAAEMEDAVWQLVYHSGVENNGANRSKFRKIIQDAMINSGYGLHDIAESAKQEIRMFQGTPGGGIDVLPEMLRAATIEARLKGSSPEESMSALIGLAHMTKEYSPEQIKKLTPAFAFLSTANPGSLSSIERAASYAVPLLQSGLEIDPMQSLLLGTALTRAGATSTKSGTWLREMALRAMPGTTMMTKMAFQKHEEALKAMGLVDDQDRPTWFTNGKPDVFKMLDIASAHATSIPIEKRAAYERALFGARGGGGFALLADPAVREQVQALSKGMNSPEFKNRYSSFMSNYNSQVTAQVARTALREFDVTLMDLGSDVLPSVNVALKGFRAILEGVRDVLPGVKNDGQIGGAAILGAGGGATVGGLIGLAGGPIGVMSGAAIGGVAGIAGAYMEQQARETAQKIKSGERPYERPGDRYEQRVERLKESQKAPKIHLNVNLDGRLIGQAVSEQQDAASRYETSPPAYDGSQIVGP